MARILVVGGGCRGRELAAWLTGRGHAVRITSRSPGARAEIERVGAECWRGTPERLATLRGALDGVTVACWLLAGASGAPGELEELHTVRLEFFLTQMIDTTVRGFVYEARGTTGAAAALAEGERIARRMCDRNAIPLAVLDRPAADGDPWQQQARAAIEQLLGGR
ncbi:MAG TPA: hypothetical protein VMB91_08815 [Solirubrobacteraceae bacterium]|nr:hypothetical protein [Solirubrobacteraceae bacterium]